MTVVHEIARLLAAAPGTTVSVAESLTSGWIQAELTSLSGSSAYYRGGVTAYALPLKTKLLGVDAVLATACDGVDPEVARQMARGAVALFESTYAVATTGYAEPSAAVPSPFAYWCALRRDTGGTGWVHEEGRVEGPGLSRIEMQEKVTQAALHGLRELLRRDRRPAQGA